MVGPTSGRNDGPVSKYVGSVRMKRSLVEANAVCSGIRGPCSNLSECGGNLRIVSGSVGAVSVVVMLLLSVHAEYLVSRANSKEKSKP